MDVDHVIAWSKGYATKQTLTDHYKTLNITFGASETGLKELV